MTRITTVSFRLGAILISISLALFLVSLIPSGESTPSTNSTSLNPQTWQPCYSGILSPQLGIHVNFNANATYKLYIIQADTYEIFTWILNHTQKIDLSNLTLFEQYLDANPTTIVRQDQKQGGGAIQYDYIPTQVVNATIIVTNPNNVYLQLTFTWNQLRPFGPSSITLLAEATLIIGLVLVLPQTATTLATRKHKNTDAKL
jgi:hypothetical protein